MRLANLKIFISCITILLFSIHSLHAQLESRVESLERNTRTLEQGLNNNQREFRQLENRMDRNVQSYQELRSDVIETEDKLVGLDSTQLIIEQDLDSMKVQFSIAQDSLASDLELLQNITGVNTNFMDRFWILIISMFGILMLAGFQILNVAKVRKEHRAEVGIKNLMIWIVISIVFYVVGFGLMFGTSAGGILGLDLFIPSADSMAALNSTYKLEFFLFQLAFAGIAVTIVSGALSERTALTSYMLTALFVGGLVYPLFGHWAWGNLYVGSNTPWLSKMGFHDFAGSTVVHSVGAWVALAGIYVIGPRRGRFDPAQQEKFRASDMGYAVLGVFILWFGWWGFNGGSTLRYNDDVSFVILNTNLAAAFAGVIAFLHAYFTDQEQAYAKLIGGVLGGLVAITACCDVVYPGFAILIGMFAGIIHNIGFDLLIKWKLDDPVGAIPVHGFCGVWGTLCVGLFGIQNKLPAGDRTEQVLIQILGIVVALVFAGGFALLFFKIMDRLTGLRLSAQQEESGLLLTSRKSDILNDPL